MYICDDLEPPHSNTSISINAETFELLFQQYWRRMYVFALKTMEDEDEAKEIVQDVFKSLWERKETLNIKDVERYLLRSVKLKSLEHIRNKCTRQRHHDVIQTQSQVMYEDEQLQVKELAFKLNAIVEGLPKQCKNVFKMSREQGLTNKEIAQILLISERAVEYHISKALFVLRTNLAEQE
ncbi:RNA polymerase sigma-70 factor [Sphingobacterium yanglingense]|uniref:RNA polymerase sigma-70 factor (ECF subfamily) n=1 Tax=Sphingobacterium yanglingense TaxID=1437280 RepID=A0A4R6W8J5_9SPHI|nr:RNA polymerase sigma-70 factor [Sphingobacterium yanglingense]TDQ75356.1 RNA polymerase sigma-70 factor (ECF subfamily) [Sphingobacterium yanglingense]